MAKTTLLQRLKTLITGGSKKSSSGGTTTTKKKKNYSQYTVNDKKTVETRREAINAYKGSAKTVDDKLEQEKEKRQESWEKTKNAFKSSSSKATPDPKEAQKEKSKADRDKFKADIKSSPKAVDLKEQRNKNEGVKRAKEYVRRMDEAEKYRPLINDKYWNGSAETKRRVKSGEYMTDADVAKYETLKNPVAASAARGAVSGASLGLSELLAAKAPKSKEMAEAEEFYQKNKNKAAEFGGEMAASLAAFGLTGEPSKAAITKLAPKATERLGARTTARLAERALVRNAARRELGEAATEEAIKRLAAEKAAKITAALGEDAAINLTSGAAMDVNRALADSNSPAEFAKNMALNVPLNLGLGTVTAAAPPLIRATGIDDAVADVGRAAARKLDDTTGSVRFGIIKNMTDDALAAERNELETALKRDEDIISKFDYDEMTRRINAIDNELNARNGASVDAAKNGAYNNLQGEVANGTDIGNNGRPQASGDAVSAVDATVSRGAGESDKAMGRVADTSRDARRGSGSGVLLKPEHRESLNKSGVPDTHLSDVSNKYSTFSNALNRAKKANSHGGWVDPQSVNDLTESGAKTFLSDDKYAGVAVKADGDIIGVFKNPKSKHRGAVYDLIYTARANGGTKMDCFGQALVNRYESVGFKPVAKIPFNPEVVSDPKLLELQPDVYVLMKNADGLDEVAARIKKPEFSGGYHRSTQEELDNLPVFNDYGEALAFRDKLLEQQEADIAKRKANASTDPLDAYKKNRAKQKADEVKPEKAVKPEAEPKVEAEPEAKPEPPKKKKAKPPVEKKLYTVEVKGKKGMRTVEVEAANSREARTLATNQEGDKWARVIGEKAIEQKPEPETGIAATGRAAETGEKVKGERTEFRRGNEETAKEQARNKRTTGNKEKATQESFDKDFADFEKKVSDTQAKVSELKDKLRKAPEDEKAAIKKQIDDLNAEVKQAYNKASLRYHPDRGGSNEWMGRFNQAYDGYKRGSYSSRGFKSAESSSRARTEASGGGGGKTPPPRRAAAASEGGNFRKPRGKAKKPTRTVSSVEDIVGKSRERVSAKEKVKNAYQAAKTKIVNSMSAFEDENLKYVKTDHEKWKTNNGKIDKHRRYNALANISVNDRQLMSSGKRYGGTVERIGADGKTYKIENGKSLGQIYSGMDEKTEAAFDAYLLLKHAPDRIREGTPIFDRINLDRADGTPIKNLNDPKVVKEEAERLLKEHPEFAEKAEEIYQYTHNELENRVRAGLLSQEKASEWMHDHPFYVPTGRDGYFNAVHGNHKGIVGADSLKAAKGSDLDIRSIKEQLAEATSRNWRDITANDLLENFFGDKVQTGLSANSGIELLNDTAGLAKSADGRKFYAKIFRDGNMNRVEIDKSFYDSLEDLYKNGSVGQISDTIASATSKLSNPFKKLVTSWNPIFLPKNFSRDMGEALINTRQTKEFVQCLDPAWRELMNDGEYARAFRDSGVSQANFVNLEESFRSEGKLAKAANKFIALQDMTESFPRLTEYMATLKKAGVDITKPLAEQNVSADLLDQAAANAADVTVNFGRSGSVGKNINKGILPFFNPSMQGWSKFTRNFREQEGTKQLLGVLGKATMLGAGLNAINNFLLSDNPNYQQISARDKATNYIIPYPPFKDGHINNDANLFIKIPQSRFAAVYGLPTVNVKNENKMGWAEMIKVAKDQVAPVDPTESHLFAPLYQAAKNETWYGAPIESDYLVENYSPSQRYDSNTSPMGKALGKATSKLPEEFQISPKRADYIIDAETGVIGDFALPASTALARGENPAKAIASVAKKGFTIDATTQNNLYAKFDDKLKKATRSNNNPDAGDAEQKELDRMNAYSAELKSVNRAIKKLQDDGLKQNQKNIYEMQKIRNQMLQNAIDGKKVPSKTKTLDAVQKYVGTSYAVENFGSSADKEAMQIYGAAKYGDLSDEQMAKKIDADTDFYKGVQSISKLGEKMEKAGIKSSTGIARAVALASAGVNDDVFDAYGCSKQSRTESDSKTNRAKTYIKDGGSEDEFVKLEKARKTLGKLSSNDQDAAIDAAYNQLKKGEISATEYRLKKESIEYNANISYIGLATSLAQANAPERGYRLYDIKDKNIQKGINLAAMGYTARDYREMSKALDTNGNGYPSKSEIIAYVEASDVEDKATLFAALYPYQGKSNPFGTPTNYTRAQAAAAGKANGVDQIGDESGEFDLNAETASGGYGSGYYRRGYRRYGRGGSSKKKATVKTSVPIKQSDFKADKATYKNMAASLQTRSTKRKKTKVPTVKAAKIEPPKVKMKKYEV